MVTEKKLPSTSWEYNQSNGNMSIPFTGRSYMLRKITSVIKGKTSINLARSTTKQKKKSAIICVLKSRNLTQHTKKVDCLVVLSVKKILTFPISKIEKGTKRRRTEASKKIKSYLEEM